MIALINCACSHKVRHKMPRPTTPFQAEISNKVAYHCGIHLGKPNYADLNKIQKYLKHNRQDKNHIN